MMTRTYDLSSITEIKNAEVVFDANVWIFVMAYCNADQDKTYKYSKIHSDLIRSDCSIIIVKNILFEFFNRCIKFEFDQLCARDQNLTGKFKSYRSSMEFRPIMEGVRDTCLNIIEENKFVSIDNSKSDLMEFISHAGDGLMDLNDLIIEKYCRDHKAILATDDRDFLSCKIDIVTANNRIISARAKLASS